MEHTKRTKSSSSILCALLILLSIAIALLMPTSWVNAKAETVEEEEQITVETIVDKIAELVNSFWIYIVMAMGAVVVIWGAYIGIRVSVANRREEQINSRAMVKGLVIGIIIMAVIAMACPLLINGLAHFVMWA